MFHAVFSICTCTFAQSYVVVDSEGKAVHSDVLSFSYPMVLPVVRFITKISHPNINVHGDIGLRSFGSNWSLALTISTVLISVQSLLSDPFAHSCMNRQARRICTRRIAINTNREPGNGHGRMPCARPHQCRRNRNVRHATDSGCSLFFHVTYDYYFCYEDRIFS